MVQRQLELYNARDLDAFMAVFAPDVVVVNADTGETIATSAADLRPRYEVRCALMRACSICCGVHWQPVCVLLPDWRGADVI